MKLVAQNIDEAIKHLTPKTGDELPNIEYDVEAHSVDRQSGKTVTAKRVERINPKENRLFKDCYSVLDIKEKYELFWNHMNNTSPVIVFVTKVTLIKK